MSNVKKRPSVKSIETKHMEERAELFRALKSLDRRSFVKVAAAAFGAAAASAAGCCCTQPKRPAAKRVKTTGAMGR